MFRHIWFTYVGCTLYCLNNQIPTEHLWIKDFPLYMCAIHSPYPFRLSFCIYHNSEVDVILSFGRGRNKRQVRHACSESESFHNRELALHQRLLCHYANIESLSNVNWESKGGIWEVVKDISFPEMSRTISLTRHPQYHL